jgi:hypothetical protein
VVVSTLKRITIIRDADEFAKRQQALESRIAPLMQKQPGFVSREMRRDGAGGGMVEVTTWQTPDDCRNYLRNGGAAMAATILDAFFPTAPYPNGNWLRETVEQ